jgi:hypothetical protein
LKVPTVREGSDAPSLLDPRKRAERARVAVGQEAYGQGVLPRRVDDLVQALGMNGTAEVRSLGSARNGTPRGSGSGAGSGKETIPTGGWMPPS